MRRMSNNGNKKAKDFYQATDIRAQVEMICDKIDDKTSFFVDMRKNENNELFQAFVEYCLIHSISSMNWRYKCIELETQLLTKYLEIVGKVYREDEEVQQDSNDNDNDGGDVFAMDEFEIEEMETSLDDLNGISSQAV